MSTTVTAAVEDPYYAFSTIFQNYPYGEATRSPTFFFHVPYVGRFGVIPLDLGFWSSTFVLLSLQAVINISVALLTYRFIVQAKTPERRYLVGYGVLLPLLLIGPLWVCHYLQLENLALLLCLVGAMPNILTLRVVEATHDMLPSFVRDDCALLVLYYSATLAIQFDIKTQQPVRLTRAMAVAKFKSFGSVFLQTSLLYSILLPLDYKLIHVATNSWFHWAHLVNAYCIAALLSLVLDGGASGLGLLTCLCTGYNLEKFSDAPLTQSTCPSDFWGQRWDRPVQATLRRGCFRPLRKAGYSRATAALLTFIASGIIHEYVLYLMTFRTGDYQPTYGTHFLFFGWNAIVLLVERALEGHPAIEWMKRTLPKPIRTALVLLTVLPIAHLFTDEYVKSGFFDDAMWGFPRLVYLGES